MLPCIPVLVIKLRILNLILLAYNQNVLFEEIKHCVFYSEAIKVLRVDNLLCNRGEHSNIGWEHEYDMELRDHKRDWLETRFELHLLFVSLDIVDPLQVVLSKWFNVPFFLTAYRCSVYELKLRVTKLKLMRPSESQWLLVFNLFPLIVKQVQLHKLGDVVFLGAVRLCKVCSLNCCV